MITWTLTRERGYRGSTIEYPSSLDPSDVPPPIQEMHASILKPWIVSILIEQAGGCWVTKSAQDSTLHLYLALLYLTMGCGLVKHNIYKIFHYIYIYFKINFV